MTLWRNFAKHIEETKARMDRGVAKVNRVRLSSAFMGLRISVSEGRSVRKITKLMFHVARRMVMKALYTWKVGTVRMRFLSGRAKDMQRQVIVKAKTKR